MATHSSTLAWRTPWTEEPCGAAVHKVAQSQTPRPSHQTTTTSQTISDEKTFEWTPNKSWQDKSDVSDSRRPFQAWESMNFSNPVISEGQRKKMWGRKLRNKILQRFPS